MGEILSVLVVGAVVLVVIRFMWTGHKGQDPINRRSAPRGNFLVFALAVLAIGQLFAWQPMSGSAASVGAIIGITLALLIGWDLTKSVLGIVGVIAALILAAQFVSAGAGSWGLDGAMFRTTLMLLVFAFFVLGGMVGAMTKMRDSGTLKLSDGKGLALFGLVEVAQFLASPGGLDLLTLEPDSFYTYLGLMAVVAAVAGALHGDFTLWVLGAAVVALSVLLPLSGAPGAGSQAGAGGLSTFFVSASVVYALVRMAVGRYVDPMR